MSLKGRLASFNIPSNCISRKTSAEENGRLFRIKLQPGEQLRRVQVDGCWLTDSSTKKLDYLFSGQSASRREVVLLVELKGANYGDALDQIESMLSFLLEGESKLLQEVSVKAYVVLSHSRSVPQEQRKVARINKKYDVLVRSRSRSLTLQGLDDPEPK